jgi:hypothetical protein
MHPDNIGQQFKDHVLVHRGIRDVDPSVARSALGVHWTHSIDVAKHFGYLDTFSTDGKAQSVVVSALVHKDHIIEPESPEWHEAQNWGSSINNVIHNPDHWEQEATVRPGSPVHITAIQHDSVDENVDFFGTSRRMSYKNPRKSQA